MKNRRLRVLLALITTASARPLLAGQSLAAGPGPCNWGCASGWICCSVSEKGLDICCSYSESACCLNVPPNGDCQVAAC